MLELKPKGCLGIPPFINKHPASFARTRWRASALLTQFLHWIFGVLPMALWWL